MYIATLNKIKLVTWGRSVISLVSSTNKDRSEILLKVALNTINLAAFNPIPIYWHQTIDIQSNSAMSNSDRSNTMDGWTEYFVVIPKPLYIILIQKYRRTLKAIKSGFFPILWRIIMKEMFSFSIMTQAVKHFRNNIMFKSWTVVLRNQFLLWLIEKHWCPNNLG